MKNANITKINRLGTAGKILSVILLVITTIALVATVIFGIAIATLPEDFLKVNGKWVSTTITDLSSPMVSRDIVENYSDERNILGLAIKVVSHDKANENNKDIVTSDTETTIEGNAGKPIKFFGIFISVLCAVMLIFLVIALRFAKALCKSLEKCDSPFQEDVVQKMKNFAISLIPWGVFCVGAGGVSAVGIVFIVIIVCLFSAIFKHGAELQRESDETL